MQRADRCFEYSTILRPKNEIRGSEVVAKISCRLNVNYYRKSNAKSRPCRVLGLVTLSEA